jgi:D-tyrosyl-tRNA(Tyr) deacylase
VLVGVTHDDDERAAGKLAAKVAGLRVFDDDNGVMNRSRVDVGGAALVVSQFTLYGDTSRGRRPSWIAAAPPDHAEQHAQPGADRAAGRHPRPRDPLHHRAHRYTNTARLRPVRFAS